MTITNGGSGYVTAPTVTFSAGGGTGAAGTAVLAYDHVGSVTITDAGSGYTSAPAVTFTTAPAGGTTAAATAVLHSSVQGVTITDAGSGYATAPTVTFSGGGGSGAAATARLGERGYDQPQNLFWARRMLSGKQLQVQVGGA